MPSSTFTMILLNLALPVVIASIVLSDRIPSKYSSILHYLHNPSGHSKVNECGKDTAQWISEYGYPSQTHEIITEDGYILKLFRLISKSSLHKPHKTRPPVLLMHGLTSSSDIWVLHGPNSSLPFLLADAGFDVYLGNARGNIYGRRHVNMTTKEQAFWRFSWHEIGYYDLSAMSDRILTLSGHDRLHYVGFSQGTTALLVLLSTRPEYMHKMHVVNLLAPVAYADYIRDALTNVLAPILGFPSAVSDTFGSREFMPFTELYLRLSYTACQDDYPFGNLCSSAAYLVEGQDQLANWTVLQRLASTHPAGASTDQLIHYLQVKMSSCFCQFNFGLERNVKMYGQAHTPAYALQNIRTPLHLWYSDDDEMSATLDVLRLADHLHNPVLHYVQSFKHGNFITAKDVRQVIYEPITKLLLGSTAGEHV